MSQDQNEFIWVNDYVDNFHINRIYNQKNIFFFTYSSSSHPALWNERIEFFHNGMHNMYVV